MCDQNVLMDQSQNLQVVNHKQQWKMLQCSVMLRGIAELGECLSLCVLMNGPSWHAESFNVSMKLYINHWLFLFCVVGWQIICTAQSLEYSNSIYVNINSQQKGRCIWSIHHCNVLTLHFQTVDNKVKSLSYCMKTAWI